MGIFLSAFRTAYTPDEYVHHVYGDLVFDKVNYPSPRYLWQEMSNAISHARTLRYLLRRRVYDPRANRTQFPEFDHEAIRA